MQENIGNVYRSLRESLIDTLTIPIVPICEAQRKDVNPKDLLDGGLFRKCDVYKGGGGYDKLPQIWKRRTGVDINPVQFVAQTWGCPLRCPYCYVTKDGVFGKPTTQTIEQIQNAMSRADLDVLHLMGGAPAIYLPLWKYIGYRVEYFHSDFLLIEHAYQDKDLRGLPGIHAVSVKHRSMYSNQTIQLFWDNLKRLLKNKVEFYITTTGKTGGMYRDILKYLPGATSPDDFNIEIKNYKALEK